MKSSTPPSQSLRESDAAAFAGRLCQANEVCPSPIAIYQAVLGLARVGNTSIQEAEAVLVRFLEEVQAQTMPISAEVGRSAIAAFDRFGEGRHPAGLEMGDCLAYARANELDVPLLFKGDDFPLTDITIA